MDLPNDDNGDVLRRLVSKGDDLTRPRDIDFVAVFTDKESADEFADHFRKLRFKVFVERREVAEGLPWDARVVNFMIPTHKAIGEFENLLESVAVPLGGRNDGWGCFSQTSDKSAQNS